MCKVSESGDDSIFASRNTQSRPFFINIAFRVHEWWRWLKQAIAVELLSDKKHGQKNL